MIFRGLSPRQVIAPHVADVLPSDWIIYGQCCLRVQPPAPLAIGVPHCDAHYGHQPGQINFWLPLVDVHGSCSLHVESAPGVGDFHPLTLQYGELGRFYGNKCIHYAVANDTDTTRISLDFRIVPGSCFDPAPTFEVEGDSRRFEVAKGGFAKQDDEVMARNAYYRRCNRTLDGAFVLS